MFLLLVRCIVKIVIIITHSVSLFERKVKGNDATNRYHESLGLKL